MVVKSFLSEEILAENVDFETYMQDYAHLHAEWVDGVVIKMSPVAFRHFQIVRFITMLLTAYLEKTHEGEVAGEPFVMKLWPEKRGREPDIFVVTTANLDRLKKTYLEGPADLVIEVVSEESIERDRGTKFQEYETGGVREYWIVDPVHKETLFYILGDEKTYVPNQPDENGIYTSYVLPQLCFKVNLMLQTPVPGFDDVAKIMREMLEE